MCAPKRPRMPDPPAPAPAPVPTPVADTKIPEVDIAVEQDNIKKKARKKLAKKSLRNDVMLAGDSGLNIPT